VITVEGRSNPGRRAVLRWAWRLFRREWRQQLLVLSLVTVTVAASVAGASMSVNAVAKTSGEFGDASALIRLDASDAPAAREGVAAARQQFGSIEVISHQSDTVPGTNRPIDVRAQDPNGIYSRPTLGLRAGRYPTRPDEIALTDGAADLLSADVGELVHLGGVQRTVVGRVENPADLNDEFALIAPDSNVHADSLTLLIHVDRKSGRAPVPAGVPGQTRFQLETSGTDTAAVSALLLVAITLAMALVCLIATAAFVVVAQRRQRQLGLLAAIGATERHLRLVMLTNGAIVGVTAAVVGSALGISGWIAAAPAVETAAGHRIDRLDLPWGLIAVGMALAVLMAIAAAWWPARTVARVPVMSALSGRPTRPAPVHRSMALAVVLIAFGVGAISAANPTSDHVRPLILIAGMVAVIVGVVLASPAAIRVLGAPAARLPFATRVALRDLVRYQARAAAALAAITLGLGISVTVIVLAQANANHRDEGNLSDQQLVIRVGDVRTAPDPDLSQADRGRLDTRAATVAAALGEPSVYTLDVAMNRTTANDANIHEPISVVTPIDHGFRGLGYPYVATSQLLQHYHIDPATISGATELLTALPGNVGLLDPTAGRNAPQTDVQRVSLPWYSSAPNSLMTENALRQHGWVRARAGWLVESSQPLTPAQIGAARDAAAAGGLTIEVRDAQDDLAHVRTVATTVGALLALAIVAMTIGLIRSESARDLRTLTATGAPAGTRRTLTASTAGALALLGVLLGTAGAYLAVVAAYHADLAKLVPLPTANLVLLVVGMPVVAAGAGWLLAGREPRGFARQALD
jgi:putative ABC transport system permease protein